MGCCNEPTTALAPGTPNPAKHVNFAKGMVLGVDDFTQEFAYLSGRDQRLAREALGYGTLSGLQVLVEDTAKGAQLRVRSGSALSPGGKLICVTADQCALFRAWLGKPQNAAEVDRLAGSPPASSVRLYLTLRYADCLTDDVPIPGEPCRSDDSLMAPSRVADDYRLELRTAAPAQVEEDALRDFVQWLKSVTVIDSGAAPAFDEHALLAALRAAAKPWFDAMAASPPAVSPAPPDYMFGSPATLIVAPDRTEDLLRVAFRFWLTEARPLWAACACGAAAPAGDDSLLLACIDLPVAKSGGVWDVSGPLSGIVVDESKRPWLLHLRMLQEWLIGGWPAIDAAAPAGVQVPIFGPTTQAITLGDADYCVISDGSLPNPPYAITLPKCAPANKGRVYVVKSIGGATPLNCTGADRIHATAPPSPSISIAADAAVTVASDGVGTWFVIARA